MTDNKTSLLIPYQLPEFIRDNPDYEKFVLFLQSYYEWMEQNNNVINRSKNILNYIDIDKTSGDFLNYFYNDFLQYFPLDMLADKARVIKVAKELYKSKGTPAAYKFLFRILYNSDVDFFNTGDAVLRASSGKWYVTKSIKFKTTDTNFLYTNNLRAFGESSKSIATIENSVLTGNKIQLFLSDIQREFYAGEIVRIVDINNQTLYFLNNEIVDANTPGAIILRSKINSQISQININPKFRGQKYLVGDPVVVYDGVSGTDSIEATAHVSEATSGAIKFFRIEDEGYGYVAGSLIRTSNSFNSTVKSDVLITGALGAVATVLAVDTSLPLSNATYVSIDTISKLSKVKISNSTYSLQTYTTNANTSLVNSLNFISIPTYPVKTIFINNGGGGIIKPPTAEVSTNYTVNYESNTAILSTLGILAPITILNGGAGYRIGDSVVLSGGSGYGAYANVSSVGTSNTITGVSYVYGDSTHIYPLGGMGYKLNALPSITVNSSNVNASNASLVVTGILGAGARLNPQTERVGSVTKISIDNYGEDYSSTPNISLRIQDILVKNVDTTNLPIKGDTVFQGQNVNSSVFIATVDSLEQLSIVSPNTQSIYKLRVFNYSSKANTNAGTLNINKIGSNNIQLIMSTALSDYNNYLIADSRYDPINGILIYGDGNAKATSQYLNGIVLSQGQYLDSTGHPSSFDVLQSSYYNNFTYEITVEKEIEKYRKVLLDLLHPSGLKYLGRYSIRSENLSQLRQVSSIRYARMLSDLNVNHAATGTVIGNFVNQSNNIISFTGLSGANLANVIFTNSFISIANSITGNTILYSKVMGISANTVTIQDNVYVTYANVALVTGNAGSNLVTINSLTGSYNFINNKNYSNTSYPLYDIVHSGDNILISNNSSRVVKTIDAINGIITLNTNLTSNVSGSKAFMSINRNISEIADYITIYGPIGVEYLSQIGTEDGNNISTESGVLITIE